MFWILGCEKVSKKNVWSLDSCLLLTALRSQSINCSCFVPNNCVQCGCGSVASCRLVRKARLCFLMYYTHKGSCQVILGMASRLGSVGASCGRSRANCLSNHSFQGAPNIQHRNIHCTFWYALYLIGQNINLFNKVYPIVLYII